MDQDIKDEHTRATSLSYGLVIGFTSLAVLLRVWARLGIVKSVEIDDGLVFVGYIFTITLCSLLISAAHNGLGHKPGEVTGDEMERFLKLLTAALIMYSWAIATVKMSFAVFYIRVFTNRRLQIFNKGLIVFLAMQAIEETFVVIFRCSPVSRAWSNSVDGSCVDLHFLWFVTFGINLTTDIILFVQPIPTTWKLKLPLAKRLGIIFMMSLGLFVTVISAIRITYVAEFFGDPYDYDPDKPMIWAAVEVGALIICACVPSVRKVASTNACLRKVIGTPAVASKSPSKTPPTGDNRGSAALSTQARKHTAPSQHVENPGEP